MAGVPGKNMLIKLGTGTGATTIAGLRPSTFTVNGETVDITNKDSGGYRELLGSAGIASASISGGGVMQGGTFDKLLADRVIARSLDLYTFTYGTNSLAGSFQCTSYEATGDYNGAQTYSASWESSGSLVSA